MFPRRTNASPDDGLAFFEPPPRFLPPLAEIHVSVTFTYDIPNAEALAQAYSKTREVYAEYGKAGYSKKFLAEHEREISLHKEAREAFDALGTKKLPSIKDLRAEYAQLMVEKKKLYSQRGGARQEMKDFVNAKSNVDRLLQYSEQERHFKNEPER